MGREARPEGPSGRRGKRRANVPLQDDASDAAEPPSVSALPTVPAQSNGGSGEILGQPIVGDSVMERTEYNRKLLSEVRVVVDKQGYCGAEPGLVRLATKRFQRVAKPTHV